MDGHLKTGNFNNITRILNYLLEKIKKLTKLVEEGGGGGTTGDYIPLSGTEVGKDAGKVKMNNSLTIPDYTSKDLIPKEYADLQYSYSTNETLTGGTWIDGKPIYRKVLEENSLNSGTKLINVNDLNIDTVIIRGYAGDGFPYIPLNTSKINLSKFITSVNATFDLDDGNVIIIEYTSYDLINDTLTYFVQPFTIILEYTKTTDVAP